MLSRRMSFPLLWGMIPLLICVGCGGYRPHLEMRLAEDFAGKDLERIDLAGGEAAYLYPEVVLDERDILTAEVVADESGRPSIHVELTHAGRQKFARVTSENVGRRLAMLYEGELLSAPTIRAPIIHGKAIITGDFNLAEARRIAETIGRPAGE